MGPNLFLSMVNAYGHKAGGYWSVMVGDICAALGRAGHPTIPLGAEDGNSFRLALAEAVPSAPRFVASFNFVGPYAIRVGEEVPFLGEFFTARSVTIFLDHPVHLGSMITRFEEVATDNKFRKGPAPSPIYGIMAPEHRHFLLDAGIPAQRIFIFQQGGPSPDPTPLPLAERPIDLLFYGSVHPPRSEAAFREQFVAAGPGFPDAAEAVLAQVLADESDVYVALKSEIARRALGQTPALVVAELANAIDRQARIVRRWRFLSRLASLRVHFCGEICEEFRKANPAGLYLGAKSFDVVFDLIRQSKIVLNDTINLRHGALMRLHYGAAAGAIMATESGPWYRDTFRHMSDALLIERDADMADIVRAVLADPGLAQSISDAGMRTHAGAHLWDHRIGSMLDTLASLDLPPQPANDGGPDPELAPVA